MPHCMYVDVISLYWSDIHNIKEHKVQYKYIVMYIEY